MFSGIGDAITKAGGQTCLARALGVTPQMVHIWLKRGYPAFKYVTQIEALYGTPRASLIKPALRDVLTAPTFEG